MAIAFARARYLSRASGANAVRAAAARRKQAAVEIALDGLETERMTLGDIHKSPHDYGEIRRDDAALGESPCSSGKFPCEASKVQSIRSFVISGNLKSIVAKANFSFISALDTHQCSPRTCEETFKADE